VAARGPRPRRAPRPGGGGRTPPRLPARFPPADNDDLAALAPYRFERRRRVVDAKSFEPLELGDARSPILRAGRDDDGLRLHGDARGQLEPIGTLARVETRRSAAHAHFGAELLGLDEGAPRQVLPRDPGAEA